MNNSITLNLGTTAVRQLDGLYSLNDLHKAAGGKGKHKPDNFMRSEQAQGLAQELCSSDMRSIASKTVKGRGKAQGTYVAEELVYAYAMWISPAFTLKVIRTFREAQKVAAPALASPYITPAQQRAIQEAVTAYVQKHQSAYGTIYSTIKTKFKVATYSQLAPADFDACMAWLEAGATVAPALPTTQNLAPLLERGTRYLVSIDDSTGQLNHKPIEHDAYVMTVDRFMAVINEPGGIFVNTAKLADLAQACMKRLAGRCLHYESQARVH